MSDVAGRICEGLATGCAVKIATLHGRSFVSFKKMSSKGKSVCMEDTEAGKVADAFRGHHEEIKRRSTYTRGDNEESSKDCNNDAFERVETDVEIPLHVEDQNFVLYSVSHVQMPPIAEIASEPAIRFYGCFPTEQECIEHAAQVSALDSSCNLQMSRTHTWNLAAKSPERISDDKACREHIDLLLCKHEENLELNTKEFKENVEKRRGGEKDPERESQQKEIESRQEMAATVHKNEATVLRKAPRLPRGGEARDQNYCVCSFLPDKLQPIPEFAWKVYACFADTATCNTYIRNTLGLSVKDHDIDVCVLAEWLQPQNVDRSKLRSEIWRAGELGSIMQQHKSQPGKVESFKKWRDAPKDNTSEVPDGAEEVTATEALGITGEKETPVRIS